MTDSAHSPRIRIIPVLVLSAIGFALCITGFYAGWHAHNTDPVFVVLECEPSVSI